MNRFALSGSLFALLAAVACTSPQHPDATNFKAMNEYILDHCSNGARMRELFNATMADGAISATANEMRESLQLDREYILCSLTTSDPWVAQATKVLVHGDSFVDGNACFKQQANVYADWRIDALDHEGRLRTRDHRNMLDSCIASSAKVRWVNLQYDEMRSTFPDIKALAEKRSAGAKETWEGAERLQRERMQKPL